MKVKLLIRSALASLILLSLPVLGIDPAESLLEKLAQQHTIEANFDQSVFDDTEKVVSKSHGQIKLSRPERFYWHIEAPDNQWIVANGDWVWVYDVDLNQVVKRHQNAQNNLPLQILTGSVPSLSTTFDVTLLPSEDKDEIRYQLINKQSDAVFSSLLLSFKANKLSSMSVKDQLGQKTFFTFNQVKMNQPIADHWFNFTPPNGVDVIVE